jgi:hypothetical protein
MEARRGQKLGERRAAVMATLLRQDTTPLKPWANDGEDAATCENETQ